ncbi:ETS-related transcription factor Elf-3-like isoform X2 [Xenia sp. Carnegie-2017]|nr:ETS-related transcription factor Elf-3-like isoform X2 [Xenia sp. Carnegie-2017]
MMETRNYPLEFEQFQDIIDQHYWDELKFYPQSIINTMKPASSNPDDRPLNSFLDQSSPDDSLVNCHEYNVQAIEDLDLTKIMDEIMDNNDQILDFSCQMAVQSNSVEEYAPWNITPVSPVFPKQPEPFVNRELQNANKVTRNAKAKPRVEKRKPKLAKRKRKRSGNRSIHLWEFLRDMLNDAEENRKYIKWISKSEGVFQLVNSGGVAKLWGQRKNRKNMTYEKMSRALRYYYEKDILERVPNARLIYKFGGKAKIISSETDGDESLSDTSDN